MDVVTILREHTPILKKQYGVEKIGIFGSFARGDEQPDSDVDILVSFRKGEKTFENFIECKFYLEELFNRKVDLVMMNSIKPRYKSNIMSEIAYVERFRTSRLCECNYEPTLFPDDQDAGDVTAFFDSKT